MPDVVVRNEIIDNKQIEIEIQTRWERTFYKVTLYKDGREHTSNVYSLDKKKAANACFNRYKRKAAWI